MPPRGRTPFDSLPEPLPGRGREFVDLLIECVECSTRKELEQAADLILVRHGWPHFAARTMLRAMRRELSKMQATTPHNRQTP